MGAETEPEVRTSEEGDRGSLASRELEKDKPGEGRPRWPGILGAGGGCVQAGRRPGPRGGAAQPQARARQVVRDGSACSWQGPHLPPNPAQPFIRRKIRTGELWEDKGCG